MRGFNVACNATHASIAKININPIMVVSGQKREKRKRKRQMYGDKWIKWWQWRKCMVGEKGKIEL